MSLSATTLASIKWRPLRYTLGGYVFEIRLPGLRDLPTNEENFFISFNLTSSQENFD